MTKYQVVIQLWGGDELASNKCYDTREEAEQVVKIIREAQFVAETLPIIVEEIEE